MHKLLVIFLFCSLFSFAQVAKDHNIGSYSINQYTDEDGLPQNMVKRIQQDNMGYIWLLTEVSLVRFDGHNFDSFNLLYSELNDDTFRDIKYVDHTSSALVPALTNNRGKFMRVENGNIIIDTSYSKKVRKELSLHPEKEVDYITQGLPNVTEKLYKPLKYVLPVGNSGYFICSQAGIQYIKNGKLIKTYHSKVYNPWKFFVMGQDLYEISQDNEIYRYSSSLQAHVPEQLDLNPELKSILRLKGLRIFWNNASGHIYFGSENALYSIEKNENDQLEAQLILSGFDFNGKNIESVFHNKTSGMIFLGSFTQGLFVLTPRQFSTLRHENNTQLDNVYYAQTKYQKNGVLSSHGNIFISNPEDGKVVKLQSMAMKERTKTDKYSMLTDEDGFIWVKNSGYLLKYDPTGNSLLKEWKLNDFINQIYLGKGNTIYIGTKNSGIYLFDPRSKEPNPILFIENIPDVTWMHEQSPNEFWVGTGKGIYWVNPQTKQVKHLEALKDIYVRSLHMTQSEEVWVTTYNNGFYLIKDRKLVRFPLDIKGYLKQAHCLFEDEKGFFWITTNKGLFQISKADLLTYAVKPFPIYYQFYSKWKGFTSNEFNGGCQPCAVRLDNGIVSLPSIDGIVWFRPEKIIMETQPANINISHLFVNGREEKITGDTLVMPEHSDMIRIVLRTPHFGDDNNLNIYYSFQRDNEKPSDLYKVDNRDKSIEMHQLGAGTYKIKIHKIRGFGAENNSIKEITLLIGKKWYETGWAMAAFVLLLGGIIYAVIQLRMKAILNQNALLEYKINERTAHLQTMLASLRSSENELARQSMLHLRTIASISHDIQSPVRFIGTAARAIQDHIETNQMDMLAKTGDLIAHTSDQIFHLIEGMLTFFKPQIKGNRLEKEVEIDLLTLLSEKISIFSGIFETHLGEIEIQSDERYTVTTNPKLLGIAIHNIIDNAIKAKMHNKIFICTDEREGFLHLIISDQGPGMPPPMIDWLNKNKPSEEGEPGSEGLGLVLIKEICQMIGVKIFVENQIGASIHLIFSPEKYQVQHMKVLDNIES